MRGIAFSPDGKFLACAAGAEVVVTNLATRKPALVLKHPGKDGSPGSVWSVAFSPDGKVLASGYTDWVEWKNVLMPVGAVKLWDMGTGREVETVRGEVLTNPVTTLAFSADGKYLAAGGRRGLTKPDKPREGDKASGGTALGELKVWTRDKLQLQASVEAAIGPVYSLAFSSDSKTVAFASGDTTYGLDDGKRTAPRGEVSFWGLERGQEAGKVTWKQEAMAAVATAPKGNVVAIGGGHFFKGPLAPRDPVGRLVLWDFGSKKQVAELVGQRFFITTVAFSPDGKLLAAGGGDYGKDAAELRLWDVATGKELCDLSAGLQPLVQSVAFSPDGKRLAAANDQTVTLWDVPAVLMEKKRQ